MNVNWRNKIIMREMVDLLNCSMAWVQRARAHPIFLKFTALHSQTHMRADQKNQFPPPISLAVGLNFALSIVGYLYV